MNVRVYSQSGEVTGELELPQSIFGAPQNEALVHQAVLRHLANQRQGTAKTKTRTEVSGGGRKPWRQKGTGRARAGSTRSPLWRTGGTTFGPQPRSFRQAMPKKARRAALRSALSMKAEAGEVAVLEGLELTGPKTKSVASLVSKIGARSVLFVVQSGDRNLYLSVRNLQGSGVSILRELNVYSVLRHELVLFMKEAVADIEEAWA